MQRKDFMKLDFDHCYAAVKAKDSRFDGIFFTAVKTTGIYCRNVCPARIPFFKNVEFYSSAAAAEGSGYRPCLRCRPETAPGSPAWNGTCTTVKRAIRLIQSGRFLDGSLDDCCEVLGVSPRHLNRLFQEHIGVSVGSYRNTFRLQSAKLLLDSTHLPISDIAFASGFGSTRRFNDAFRQTYDCSPSQARKKPQLVTQQGFLTVRLGYREPFSWDFFVDYIGARAARCVEYIDRQKYLRSISISGKSVLLRVCPVPNNQCLEVTIPNEHFREIFRVCEKVRDVFDLRANIIEITERLKQSAIMKRFLGSRAAFPVPGSWELFELGVRTIVGQQISVRAATTVTSRIVERCGERVQLGVEEIQFLFPTPSVIAQADLSNLGMNRTKVDTIKRFAMNFARVNAASTLEEKKRELSKLKGIGPWTIEYIAMRALKDPNAFPAADLGVLKALSRKEERIKPKQASFLSQQWEPYRSYAVYVLWNSLGEQE